MTEAEKTRKLADFKTSLEKRIRKAERNLEDLKVLLELLNEILLEKGFKRANIAKPKPKSTNTLQPALKFKTTIPLKTVTGELLANFCVSRDILRVVPAENMTFDINTPPFRKFLIERVLDKMRDKDNQAADKGELTTDEILSYELILDGNFIKDLVIRNVSEQRMRELRSSIHWTLEKMNEKKKK